MSERITEVLFCTDGIFPHAVGGMQRHSRLLVERLAAMPGIKLIVVHPHENIKVFNDPNITEEVIPSQKTGIQYLVDCYNYSKKVYAVAQKYPNAVIYSQGLSVWHRIRKMGKRVIVNPHGLESYQTLSMRDYLIGIPFRLVFNYLFRNAAKVVSLGGRLTGILEKRVNRNKIVVLPNAVNVPAVIERNFINEKKIQYLFVGRFALNKGINILAETVKQLNDEGLGTNLVFNLVGKGPLFDNYIKKYNFPNLNFLGFADDDQLNKLYRTNDVFVLPTLFEGMPTVVLEAMAHGMPIIVTDVGATREMVDASNGFIIDKNNVQSLRNAILEYASLPADKKKLLSLASYKRVRDNFTWEIVADQHAQLFHNLNSAVK